MILLVPPFLKHLPTPTISELYHATSYFLIFHTRIPSHEETITCFKREILIWHICTLYLHLVRGTIGQKQKINCIPTLAHYLPAVQAWASQSPSLKSRVLICKRRGWATSVVFKFYHTKVSGFIGGSRA